MAVIDREAISNHIREMLRSEDFEKGKGHKDRHRAAVAAALKKAQEPEEPVQNANWDESKHKRDHGKFSKTAGAKGGKAGKPSAKPKVKKPKPGWLSRNKDTIKKVAGTIITLGATAVVLHAMRQNAASRRREAFENLDNLLRNEHQRRLRERQEEGPPDPLEGILDENRPSWHPHTEEAREVAERFRRADERVRQQVGESNRAELGRSISAASERMQAERDREAAHQRMADAEAARREERERPERERQERHRAEMSEIDAPNPHEEGTKAWADREARKKLAEILREDRGYYQDDAIPYEHDVSKEARDDSGKWTSGGSGGGKPEGEGAQPKPGWFKRNRKEIAKVAAIALIGAGLYVHSRRRASRGDDSKKRIRAEHEAEMARDPSLRPGWKPEPPQEPWQPKGPLPAPPSLKDAMNAIIAKHNKNVEDAGVAAKDDPDDYIDLHDLKLGWSPHKSTVKKHKPPTDQELLDEFDSDFRERGYQSPAPVAYVAPDGGVYEYTEHDVSKEKRDETGKWTAEAESAEKRGMQARLRRRQLQQVHKGVDQPPIPPSELGVGKKKGHRFVMSPKELAREHKQVAEIEKRQKESPPEPDPEELLAKAEGHEAPKSVEEKDPFERHWAKKRAQSAKNPRLQEIAEDVEHIGSLDISKPRQRTKFEQDAPIVAENVADHITNMLQDEAIDLVKDEAKDRVKTFTKPIADSIASKVHDTATGVKDAVSSLFKKNPKAAATVGTAVATKAAHTALLKAGVGVAEAAAESGAAEAVAATAAPVIGLGAASLASEATTGAAAAAGGITLGAVALPAAVIAGIAASGYAAYHAARVGMRAATSAGKKYDLKTAIQNAHARDGKAIVKDSIRHGKEMAMILAGAKAGSINWLKNTTAPGLIGQLLGAWQEEEKAVSYQTK